MVHGRSFLRSFPPAFSSFTPSLGALLVQFPWSFRNEPENRTYVRRLRNRFAEYPVVVEVRHGSWMESDVLDEFAALGVGLCNIDQPLFRSSVKPTAITTSTIDYVRLHGRNYQQWFTMRPFTCERVHPSNRLRSALSLRCSLPECVRLQGSFAQVAQVWHTVGTHLAQRLSSRRTRRSD